MKFRPILFNTEMVQAILDGRKTVTRRLVRTIDGKPLHLYSDIAAKRFISQGKSANVKASPCNPGDILWVRETWQYVFNFDDSDNAIDETGRFVYYADSPMPFDYWVDTDTGEHKDQMPWKPSIHMPKEAARIFLQVKDIRVERLQDISEVQALMEGCYMYRTPGEPKPGYSGTAIEDFQQHVWDNTLDPAEREIYGWDANPWVWVIEFERCEEPNGWEVYLYG